MDLKDVDRLSEEIRSKYHELEKELHGSTWSVEEDVLAFLTDAGLVGRLTMDNQGRWPSENRQMLPSKIGECVWWLAVLAQRMGCSQQYVSNILRGNSNMTLETIAKLEDALGIDILNTTLNYVSGYFSDSVTAPSYGNDEKK